MSQTELDLNLVCGSTYTVGVNGTNFYDCIYDSLVHGSWDAPFAIKFWRNDRLTVFPWVSITHFYRTKGPA